MVPSGTRTVNVVIAERTFISRTLFNYIAGRWFVVKPKPWRYDSRLPPPLRDRFLSDYRGASNVVRHGCNEFSLPVNEFADLRCTLFTRSDRASATRPIV